VKASKGSVGKKVTQAVQLAQKHVSQSEVMGVDNDNTQPEQVYIDGQEKTAALGVVNREDDHSGLSEGENFIPRKRQRLRDKTLNKVDMSHEKESEPPKDNNQFKAVGAQKEQDTHRHRHRKFERKRQRFPPHSRDEVPKSKSTNIRTAVRSSFLNLG
jgi:hypothetical protein